MALTRDFRQTVEARADRDPGFRQALLQEAVGPCLATGKSVLHDYINVTISLDVLGRASARRPRF